MKECDKRKSQKSSKLHIIYISSNNVGHPVTNIKSFKVTQKIRKDEQIYYCVTMYSPQPQIQASF
jgi:uncharacterized protein YlbG (UPF0298 family)